MKKMITIAGFTALFFIAVNANDTVNILPSVEVTQISVTDAESYQDISQFDMNNLEDSEQNTSLTMQLFSNILKTIHDTASSIIRNLK